MFAGLIEAKARIAGIERGEWWDSLDRDTAG